MVKHVLAVVTSPRPGQEEEFNRWYTEQHLQDVLRIPGFTTAQRFKLATHGPNGIPGSYLAIYEFETVNPTDDTNTAFVELAKAVEAGQMFISPAMDPSKVSASIFTPITEKVLSTP